MTQDPIVEEVRQIREEYAARFGYDLRAMCEDLRRRADEQGLKTVSLPPRRSFRPTASTVEHRA